MSSWDQDGMTPELLQIIISKTEGWPNGYLKWVNVIRSAGAVLRDDHGSVNFFAELNCVKLFLLNSLVYTVFFSNRNNSLHLCGYM